VCAGPLWFVDLFREHPTRLFGLAVGQVLNLAPSGIARLLVVMSWWRRLPPCPRATDARDPAARHTEWQALRWQPPAFSALLAFSLLLPSDWTQDIPARYGKRHPGLRHSAVCPRIGASP
jgi:hypothetical protein